MVLVLAMVEQQVMVVLVVDKLEAAQLAPVQVTLVHTLQLKVMMVEPLEQLAMQPVVAVAVQVPPAKIVV